MRDQFRKGYEAAKCETMVVTCTNCNNVLLAEVEELKERVEKWKTWHDAASEDAKKWRREAQELQGELGRYYEDGRKMKMESDHFREALQKIEDCDECDPEISISLLQLIAREALADRP